MMRNPSRQAVFLLAATLFALAGAPPADAQPVGATPVGAQPAGQHSARAQRAPSDPSWHEESTAVAPPANMQGEMAYDSDSQQTILFGGYNSPPGPSDETWAWDGSTWTQLHPAVSPPASYGDVMAYDPVRHQMVFLGDLDDDSGSDTWVFAGGEWTQLHPAEAPLPLVDASLAFDPHLGQLVLFGGLDYGMDASNETWTWDGVTWVLLHPAKDPPARFGAGLAYDKSLGALVLFGGLHTHGLAPGTLLPGTWTWNGTNWARLDLRRSPLGHEWVSMTAFGRHVALFGGLRHHSSGQTWVLRAHSWRQLRLDPAPPARYGAPMAWDATHREAVLFGGKDSWPLFGDTWTLKP